MTSHPAPPLIFSVLAKRAAATPTLPARPRAAATPTLLPKPVSAEDRQEFQAGADAYRKRATRLIYSNEFATNPVVAAHLMTQTQMSASEIIGLLRYIVADAEIASMNNQAAIADRWDAAARRAGIA